MLDQFLIPETFASSLWEWVFSASAQHSQVSSSTCRSPNKPQIWARSPSRARPPPGTPAMPGRRLREGDRPQITSPKAASGSRSKRRARQVGNRPRSVRASGEKARGLPGSPGQPCPLRTRLRRCGRLLLAPGCAMRGSSGAGSPAARAEPRTRPPAPAPARPLLHPLAPQNSRELPKGLPCRSPACPF